MATIARTQWQYKVIVSRMQTRNGNARRIILSKCCTLFFANTVNFVILKWKYDWSVEDLILIFNVFHSTKKRGQQKHKSIGIFDLIFVKLMHQSGFMAVAVVLSEFSRCFVRFFKKFYLSCATSLKIVIHKYVPVKKWWQKLWLWDKG